MPAFGIEALVMAAAGPGAAAVYLYLRSKAQDRQFNQLMRDYKESQERYERLVTMMYSEFHDQSDDLLDSP